MSHGQLIGIIEQLSGPVLADLGFTLVDALFVPEAGRLLLRIKIDHRDAHGPTSHVTLGDCTAVSRALSAVFDVEAQIPMAYTLEVSSPGLDRRLRHAADFARFAGSLAEIRTKQPLDGGRVFHGVLGSLDDDTIVITVDNTTRRIPIAQIERAKLKATMSLRGTK